MPEIPALTQRLNDLRDQLGRFGTTPELSAPAVTYDSLIDAYDAALVETGRAVGVEVPPEPPSGRVERRFTRWDREQLEARLAAAGVQLQG